MRLFSLTVGRNEVGRYLKPMIEHTVKTVDIAFYVDDQSDDGSLEVARAAGAVGFRREHGASFLENEGMFRGAAWQVFEAYAQPTEEDWVIVLDCDEFVVGDVRDAALSAEGRPVDLRIPEVFGFDSDGTPLMRVDGFWGIIHAPRLFPYRPGGGYPPLGFGVPAVPNYVMASMQTWVNTDKVVILHYGYARIEDQIAKHARYSGHLGHSNEHVGSIIYPNKALVRWEEDVPWHP